MSATIGFSAQILVQQYLSLTDIKEMKKIEDKIIESIAVGDTCLISACRSSCLFGALLDNEEFRDLRERGDEIGYVVLAYKETAICWAKNRAGFRKLFFDFRNKATCELKRQTMQF